MHYVIIIFASNYLSIDVFGQDTYYVSTSGNNSSNGLTQATAWRTITYAASSSSPVGAGDIVYIKAGNYGAENVVFQKSGTSGNPVIFEGYKSTPGDNPDLNYSFGDPLDPSIMPLLNGGNRSISVGIEAQGRSYLHIKNIQIRDYQNGISARDASYQVYENIIGYNFGNINEGSNGAGMRMWGSPSHNIIRNSVLSNGCSMGFDIYGDYNLIDNCEAYCDQGISNIDQAMDYYISVFGSNNTIVDSYVERIGNLAHKGHGFSILTNGSSENNLVKNCTAKNFGGEAFAARHRGVKYNTFEDCTVIGGERGFVIRDGASYNRIIRGKTINVANPTGFWDTSEDGGAQYTGRYNTFEYCIFQGSSGKVIEINDYAQPDSPCDNNSYINCVIDGGAYLFDSDRTNYDNKLINCIITNVSNLSTGSHSLNTIYENCNFYNNGFSAPSGTNIITTNPDFVNGSSNDYHLNDGSPCINLGKNMSLLQDFDGNAIVGNPDIGAYEYQDGGSTVLVTSISVSGQGGATSISVNNGTLQMIASVLPSNATNKTVSWSVINGTGQATINSSGILQAVSNGTVTVRATANDGSGVVGSRVITISNQIVLVTSISVSGQGGATSISVNNGTLQMIASVLPSNATNKTVTWSVINGTGQATINSSGLLQAVSNGSVTVRATAPDGSGVQGNLVVTISNQTILVTGISVSGQGGATSISVNNGTLQMSANVSPSDATNKSVTWSVINGTGAGNHITCRIAFRQLAMEQLQ